jgi:hypothetical protein
MCLCMWPRPCRVMCLGAACVLVCASCPYTIKDTPLSPTTSMAYLISCDSRLPTLHMPTWNCHGMYIILMDSPDPVSFSLSFLLLMHSLSVSLHSHLASNCAPPSLLFLISLGALLCSPLSLCDLCRTPSSAHYYHECFPGLEC